MHYIQYGIGCLLSLLLTGAKGHEDKLFTRGPAFAAYPYPTFFIECPGIGASGSRMDIAHAYDGSGYFPELRWPITTPDTQEYVLVCEDPDEPLAAPVIHGLYYGIPPVLIGLHRSDFIEADSRNDPYRLRGGFKYGANSGGGVYLAPQPARGQGPHRYFFELIALNHTIDQSKLSPMATFDEIARQIESKIIGWARIWYDHKLEVRFHDRDSGWFFDSSYLDLDQCFGVNNSTKELIPQDNGKAVSKCKEEGRPCTLHELKKTYTMELVCDCESVKGRINLDDTIGPEFDRDNAVAECFGHKGENSADMMKSEPESGL
ncbi:phosphatidylethanolamine-binding protein [Aspergillus transmontanensis]|uniref:Phosphatidylethanolamine-binding protein n=1 Tax=Aspergillus transmontanensis TaxID=1034304 RepID=A0A5N6WCT9_9EURO|nr:phosphatidylethanolamine-binding protein [Aspergillus transmontanensis]